MPPDRPSPPAGAVLPLVALRPLSIGEILDGPFTIYRRNFVILYGTQLALFALPLLLCHPAPVLAVILAYPLGFLAFLAAFWQASEAALGRTPRFGRAVSVGLRRFLPALVAVLVVTLITVVGFFLLVVPMVIAWIVTFAVIPVVLIEKDWTHCLERSWALARHSWKRIFLVLFLVQLIAGLPGMALGIAAGINQVLDPTLQQPAMFVPPPLFFSLQLLVQALANPFAAAADTLLYYDQRVRKEGLDVDLAIRAVSEWTRSEAGAPAGSGG